MGKRGPKPKYNDKARQLLQTEKCSPKEAAERLGCSQSHVYYIANRLGLKLKNTHARIDKDLRKKWEQVLLDSPTQAEAARRMGKSRQAASRMAAVLGIEKKGVK